MDPQVAGSVVFPDFEDWQIVGFSSSRGSTSLDGAESIDSMVLRDFDVDRFYFEGPRAICFRLPLSTLIHEDQ